MFNITLNPLLQLNNIKWPPVLIMVVLFLLTTSACNLSMTQQGSGGEPSENAVDVFIEPDGRRPLVFVTQGGTKICRRGLPNESIYGLAPDETTETEDTATTDGTSSAETPQQQTRTQNITIEVGENWFEMGLLIVNKSKSYYLVIEQLMFSISANYGSELLTHRETISSGYCGTDPLYIIPPTRKDAKEGSYAGDRYQPFRKSYVNNLTLYVSGIPIPEGPPPQREEETGGANGVDEIRANAQNAIQTIPRAPEAFVLTYLPNYRVQLLLNGYWIDRNRNNVANFRKKINFSLSSQFLN